MRRGDLVVVAMSGEYGKPRPAVVVQSDALPTALGSIILCPLTSDLSERPELRITVDPRPENGLQVRSQIMADKPITVRHDRIGKRIGSLRAEEVALLNGALALALGLAD